MRKGRLAPLQALHPMNAFAASASDMTRVRVNRLETRLAPLIPFPHKHDFFHLLAIERGRGWHEIDFVRTPARPGQFYFMKPGQVHAWELAANTRGFVIEFEASALESDWLNVVDPWRMPDAFLIPASARAELLRACEDLLSEGEGPTPESPLLTKLEFGALLVRLARWASAEKSAVPQPVEAARFQASLEANFRREHSVEFYAREAGFPPKAFAMRLARALGRSPRDLIHARCLLEAQRLLAYSEASIAEISEQLGFESANYFARLFRSKIGSAPGEFRRGVRARSGRDD